MSVTFLYFDRVHLMYKIKINVINNLNKYYLFNLIVNV